MWFFAIANVYTPSLKKDSRDSFYRSKRKLIIKRTYVILDVAITLIWYCFKWIYQSRFVIFITINNKKFLQVQSKILQWHDESKDLKSEQDVLKNFENANNFRRCIKWNVKAKKRNTGLQMTFQGSLFLEKLSKIQILFSQKKKKRKKLDSFLKHRYKEHDCSFVIVIGPQTGKLRFLFFLHEYLIKEEKKSMESILKIIPHKIHVYKKQYESKIKPHE